MEAPRPRSPTPSTATSTSAATSPATSLATSPATSPARQHSPARQYSPPPTDIETLRSLAGHRILVDPVATLAEEIQQFDKDPTILEALAKHVIAGEEELKTWFTELRKGWDEAPPTTPMDAARLFCRILFRLQSGCATVLDLEGFLLYYSLPHCFLVVKEEFGDKINLPRFVESDFEQIRWNCGPEFY